MKTQKEIKKEKENPHVLTVAFILLIISMFLLILNCSRTEELKRDYGCYIFHVQECLNCQEKNLTYLWCSGFCVEPSPQDLDGKGCPVIHPSKNCFDLPKECVLD